jgi:hypothetical protein
MSRITKQATINLLKETIETLDKERNWLLQKIEIMEKIPRLEASHILSLLSYIGQTVEALAHAMAEVNQLRKGGNNATGVCSEQK